MLGDPEVGKTSLIQRYCNNTFAAVTEHTTVIDSCSRHFDGYEIKVWDTAGQECFKSLNRLYYRDVKACLFVHDVNRGTDYSSLDAWIDEFMETASVSTQEYYVNKSSIAS